MILNLNKNKYLVISRSKTVNPLHGDLVLSGVSIRESPNLDTLGVKFDSNLIILDHVCSIFSRVFLRIRILRLVKRIYVDTYVLLRCNYAFVLQSLSIVLWCGGRLLNVIFSFTSARCIRWSGFALIRVSCSCVIKVMMLGYVCCRMLI